LQPLFRKHPGWGISPASQHWSPYCRVLSVLSPRGGGISENCQLRTVGC
jgi:hypothetical protein